MQKFFGGKGRRSKEPVKEANDHRGFSINVLCKRKFLGVPRVTTIRKAVKEESRHVRMIVW